MTQNVAKAQDVMLDKISSICKKYGLNNIMAQLYVILYTSNKPLSLNEMVDRLKISKGSVSVNIRALERYGAARRVLVKGSRQDYYEAEADIYKVTLDRIRSMAGKHLADVGSMITVSQEALHGAASLNSEEEESVKVFSERLARLRELYDQAQAFFDLFNATVLNSGFVAAVKPAKESFLSKENIASLSQEGVRDNR